MEGDSFQSYSFSCAPIKKAMLEKLSSAIHKLAAHTMLNIPKKLISEVADAIEIARSLVSRSIGLIESWERLI